MKPGGWAIVPTEIRPHKGCQVRSLPYLSLGLGRFTREVGPSRRPSRSAPAAPAGQRSIRRSLATLPSLRATSAAPQFIPVRAVFGKKIRFGHIPRSGCRRGKEWEARRSQPREVEYGMEGMYSKLPCLSSSAAVLAPPTVGRALQVAEKGECSHGDTAAWLAATRAGALERTRSQGLAQPQRGRRAHATRPATLRPSVRRQVDVPSRGCTTFWLAATRAGALERTRSQGLAQPQRGRRAHATRPATLRPSDSRQTASFFHQLTQAAWLAATRAGAFGRMKDE
jgi:hypothetical protein